MSKKLFIIGTDTEVGKTRIAGLIVKKLLESGAKTAYFKPAASGNDVGPDGAPIPGDPLEATRLAGSSQPLETTCPFLYRAAVSPALAARWENRPFDANVAEDALKRLDAEYEYVVIEGAGGLACPLRDDEEERLLLVDLIQKWRVPCLLVARSTLGTINAVALTAWTLRAREIPLCGIVLNRWSGDALQLDSARMCAALGDAPVVARVPDGADEIDVAPELLRSFFV